MKYEDKDICAKCGGRCCNKCGCDYSAKDFKQIDKSTIIEALATERISIVAAMIFNNLNGKLHVTPFLYLRARNQNRDIVDLLSFKTRCMMLTETGCTYSFEERPFGARNLIPKKRGACHPDISPLEILNTWKPYQQLLYKIVKRYTGKTVYEKLEEDVSKLFYDIAKGNLEGVTDDEKREVNGMIKELVTCYPTQAKLAIIKAENEKQMS